MLRQWKFQLGLALILLPLAYPVYKYATMYSSAIESNAVDSAQIQQVVQETFCLTLFLIPVQLTGIVLLIIETVKFLRGPRFKIARVSATGATGDKEMTR